MNANINYSWIEIQHPLHLSFRKCYFYWDKEPFIGLHEFNKRKVKVRRIIGTFTSEKHSYVGILISCWKKDKTKVEQAMTQVDKKLQITDNEYIKFINRWKDRVAAAGECL